MVKIVFSKVALIDLRDIIEYIKQDSIKYARLEKEKINEAIYKIPISPLIGRIVPELADENIRELIFRNYRIIYKILPNQINILSIHHHARLISNNPAFKNDE